MAAGVQQLPKPSTHGINGKENIKNKKNKPGQHKAGRVFLLEEVWEDIKKMVNTQDLVVYIII